MKHNDHIRKKGGRATWLTVLIGVGVALACSALMSAGLTSLVMNGHVELKDTAVVVFIIRALSALVGGLLASSLTKEKFLLVIGLTAAGYLLVLLGLGITVFDGSFRNFGGGVLSAIAGGTSACMIRLKPPARKKHAYKYIK